MKPRKATIVMVLCGVLLAISALGTAQTYVGGFILTDTTWTQAASPYIVEDSLVVIAGATLTIDPDVEVRFEPGLALVVDTGALVARGTELSPIRFTANQGAGNGWGYIQLSDGAVNASFDGGGNYLAGSILEHAVVEYAGNTSLPGAVRAVDSSPFIHACTVQENARGGIHVYNQGANSIRLAGNTVTGTSTNWAVRLYQVTSAEFSGNTLGGSSITGNSAGGVLFEGSGSPTLTDNTITHNSGVSGGGVHFTSSGSATLTGNTISHNTASGHGGGVCFWYSGSATLTGNTITDNTASTYGGGAYFYSSGSATLTGNTITDNTASTSVGGGVYFRSSGSATLTGNTITTNTASSNGGGVCLGSSGSSALADNAITGNTAGNQGGGIYADNCDDVTLTGDCITGNHISVEGRAGGIFLTGGSDRWDLTGPSDDGAGFVAPFVILSGNDGYQFYDNNAFGGGFGYSDPGNVDARYVCWGTTDVGEIEAGIHDFFDGADKGVVFYPPFVVLGDANLDRAVNLLDLITLANNWQQSPRAWGEGNFNCDEVVNLQDLILLASEWGWEAAAGGGDVPEPAALALLALGACLALLRRRRA